MSFQVPSGWRRRTSIALLRTATASAEPSSVVLTNSFFGLPYGKRLKTIAS